MLSLRVAFVDFWPGFQPEHLRIYRRLKRLYNCFISETPDLLFCGPFLTHENHVQKYKCSKILLSGENLEKRFFNIQLRNYDLSLLCHHVDLSRGNAHFLPYTLTEKRFERMKTEKTKFACYVVGNGNSGDGTEARNNLYLKIMRMAKEKGLIVDSCGTYLNNTGVYAPKSDDERCQISPEWLSQYKFNICGENSYTPGYFTEKIYQAFLAGCIPVYLTHPENFKYINSKAGIFGTSEADIPQMCERVFSLTDEEKETMLAEPPFLYDPNFYLKKELELISDLIRKIQRRPRKIFSLVPFVSDLKVIWRLDWEKLVEVCLSHSEPEYFLAFDKLASYVPFSLLERSLENNTPILLLSPIGKENNLSFSGELQFLRDKQITKIVLVKIQVEELQKLSKMTLPQAMVHLCQNFEREGIRGSLFLA